MRGLLMLGGLAVVLAAAGGAGRAADDEAYDLRGPAPKKGQVFVSKGTLKIKDADTALKIMGMEIKLKMTMNASSEEEAKVLAVDGRNVTKCQTKMIKEVMEVSADIGGEPMTIPSELQGEIIISERIGENKWKHSLVDTQPSEKQKKDLDNRNGIENDDDLYPKEKVKVGAKWKVDAKALTKMLGNSFTDIKGELDQTFTKTEEIDGQKCAVVESSGTVKGKMKDDDGMPTLDVELELKVTTWKAIETGVAVKEKFDGKIRMKGTQKIEDAKAEIDLSGPISGESTTKMK
ncbi:MAG TPA: hypothetical protein VM529_26515 [Gemmata sp.]|nr:hypothetical protein [Gemmata sp.]